MSENNMNESEINKMIDFNNLPDLTFDLIPAKTIVKVVMTITSDPNNRASTPLATLSKNGSEYLNCTFTVTEGKYAKRKIFHKIGVKGNEKWVSLGKILLKNILESAKNINKNDESETAKKARTVSSFADFCGLEFLAQVGIQINNEYGDRNYIVKAITPDSPLYSIHLDTIPW